MGGAVSSGYDNDNLIDNLREAEYIRTLCVERAFRAVDRAEYFLPDARYTAYKDLAWRSGHFHISAPCIYSEVMERLCLKPGLSFLNLGSGTGYLSTMAGLILGSNGINHGIEIYEDVIEYAIKKLEDFKKYSGAIDEYDFCEPKFKQGNCLCLMSDQQYDRVYCGAACPEAFINYMKNLLRVDGILVIPFNDQLLQVKRTSAVTWDVNAILPVSFSSLIMPVEGKQESVELFDIEPQTLQYLCRSKIRNILRSVIDTECPNLKSNANDSKCTKNGAKSVFSVRKSASSQLGMSNRRNENVNNIFDIVMDHLVYIQRRTNVGDGNEPNDNDAEENNDEQNDLDFLSSDSDSEVETASESAQDPGNNIDAGTVNAIEGFVVNVLQEIGDLHQTEYRSNNRLDESTNDRNETEVMESSVQENNDDNVDESNKAVNGENASGSSSQENRPKRTICEKIDSGLGDDIIEKDTSISSESSDLDQMDFVSDDSSSSNNDGQSKRNKRLSKQSKLRSKCRRFRTAVGRLYSISSTDSEHMEDEVDLESTEPRVVPSPYTVHMQSKIQNLPLPTILKKYLNYYRDF